MKNSKVIEKPKGTFTQVHKNGKSIVWVSEDKQINWIIKGRLKWFDEHGTMKGY